MSYERDLVFNLRLRGLTENRMVDALSEVKAHTLSTGALPESEFGTAEEYALTFPKTKRPTRGRWIVVSAFALAVVYVVIVFALKALGGFDARTVVGPVLLWPALVILAVGLLVGFLSDYLRPIPRSS
ncbi:MAG: hypothetical protein LH624_19440 [Cryobacterium sp.]|nr:hypothetical protein [Cryobacterium sp.]